MAEYIEAAGIADNPKAPLFQTAKGKTGVLTGRRMAQPEFYLMVRRRLFRAASSDRLL